MLLKPKFMIDLRLIAATTVALDRNTPVCSPMVLKSSPSGWLRSATRSASGSGVCRRPEYDKMIDSKFADMKNTGGRYGGAITAAQLLQRFVDKTPWAHLDIAGTAMGSPQTDINRSWGSGFGVRLLDRLTAEYYEK
jgi:leucyl aminopeptidase